MSKLIINKNNQRVEIPYIIWEDILKIIYVRDKRLFEILKGITEELNQTNFDMNIVTYRQNLRLKNGK